MKKLLLLSLSSLVLILMTSGCIKDKCEQSVTYTGLVPVYMSYEDFRSSIISESPRDLEHPGKLYFWNDYIFISEINEGVHIINNKDPKNPQNETFIKVLGNRDIAVKDGYLYVDAHIDMVVLDISDMKNIREVDRIENVFPFVTNNQGFFADPNLGIVRAWKEEEITEVVDCNSYYVRRDGFLRNGFFQEDRAFTTLDASLGGNNANGFANVVANGVGGSLSRFGIVGDMLYAVTDMQMIIFDTSDPANLATRNRVDVGFGIETIFPYRETLFIGSQAGMFIYDIKTPTNPTFISEWQHFRACDPVAVENNTAYVTLRTGTGCPGTQNQLHVVDITDMQNPSRTAIYQMTNPAGLGINNNTLFICDGADGLKVYNAKDPLKITDNLIGRDATIQALDVIPLGKILLLIGEDGFHQYDYSDLSNIHKISSIPVVQ